MYVFITVLIVIVSLLLVFFVIIQNSKGGGLAAGFSSSNQVMGVRKTTDFLEKATWYLAGILVVLCVLASIFSTHSVKIQNSEIKENIQNAIPVDPNAPAPSFGTAVPQGQSNGEAPQQHEEPKK